MSELASYRVEVRSCEFCGKEFKVNVDAEGKVHSFDPEGKLCSFCSYDKHLRSLEEEDPYDEDFREGDEWDSGFLGSMLEAQLVRDGQVVCGDCGRKVSSVLDRENVNPCQAKAHTEFKLLFDVRLEIGKHDLETRGYD